MHYSFPLYPILVTGFVFKELNEMNGYARGDNRVRTFTQRIDDATRGEDTSHTDARRKLAKPALRTLSQHTD